MNTVYRIREWDARYEVNSGNSAWKPGQEKRRGALTYIRMPVNGRSLTRPMMRLNTLAGKNAPAVFGVFTKLMELAADNDPALRGQIIDSDGTPLTAKDIAEILCWPVSTIESALKVLSHKDLRWVEQVPVLGTPRNPKEVLGKPISETETETETETEAEAEADQDARAGRTLVPAAEVIRAWNEVAEKRRWPKCSKVPDGKAGDLFRERLQDPYFAANYRAALDAMAEINWNERPFRISTLMQPDRVRALIDGEWGNKPGVHTGGFDLGF